MIILSNSNSVLFSGAALSTLSIIACISKITSIHKNQWFLIHQGRPCAGRIIVRFEQNHIRRSAMFSNFSFCRFRTARPIRQALIAEYATIAPAGRQSQIPRMQFANCFPVHRVTEFNAAIEVELSTACHRDFGKILCPTKIALCLKRFNHFSSPNPRRWRRSECGVRSLVPRCRRSAG